VQFTLQGVQAQVRLKRIAFQVAEKAGDLRFELGMPVGESGELSIKVVGANELEH
jgi:hypothetical protein